MYICDKCDEYFAEPDVKRCSGDEYDYITVCPFCGCLEITEAELCDDCKEYHPKEDMIDGLCPECHGRAYTPYYDDLADVPEWENAV